MTYWKKYNFTGLNIDHQIKNPVVLGFSAYFHDSSAVVIKDGKVLVAAEEERFSRVKHDSSFPENAIKFCLRQAKVKSVDAVVYFENPDIKWNRISEVLRDNPPPAKTYEKITEVWDNVKSKPAIQQKFLDTTGLDNEVLFLDHHLSHASSAYFVSGFKKAAIVTIDGVGEKNTTAWGIGKGNHIELKECIEFPDSIGLLYTTLTTFLGFNANDDESKIMGLSAYGNQDKTTNKFYPLIKKLITQNEDSSFKLNMKYFGHDSFDELAYSPEMINLIGIPVRKKDQQISSAHKDIAAALQMITEEVVLNILNYVYKQTGLSNLCLAGGVALNSVINGKILGSTTFEQIFIQPAAGDSGTALGAAKYIQSRLDPESPAEHMEHSYLGPNFTDMEIKNYLETDNIFYSEFESREDLLSQVADLLAKQKVVGWFQGAMEWGPRALGNRSILASPLDPNMKDILNKKVKHREMFRPFAPAVCADDAIEYFEIDLPIPKPAVYMMMVYKVRNDKRDLLPAITHVNGTARPQVVKRRQNSLFYDLVKEFGQKTGTPVLVNTSFNVRGEPIVCTPMDAYKCMMGTEIDYLVMENFLIKRSENLSINY